MNRRDGRRLLDEAFSAYVGWLEESEAVWDAYDRWTSAAESEWAMAFGTYRAALDREEQASNVYAALVVRVPTVV